MFVFVVLQPLCTKTIVNKIKRSSRSVLAYHPLGTEIVTVLSQIRVKKRKQRESDNESVDGKGNRKDANMGSII